MRLALLLPLALVACGRAEDKPQDIDSLDNELTAAAGANAADPAIAAALRDQIMVDPNLQQQSNANAVKPPPRPDPGSIAPDVPLPDPVDAASLRPAPAPGPCPECKAKAGTLTLGALAGRTPRAAGCAQVGYSAAWANRLPAALPLYPDARVAEAAGNDGGGCSLRIVSFASSATPAKLIDYYYTRATAGGYSAEHRADGALHLLGGTRGEAAYAIYAAPRPGGGADVDLLVTGG